MSKITDILNILNDPNKSEESKQPYLKYKQVGNLIDKATGTIPDNQWANVMRCSMENKNLLAKKGSLYIGTGDTVSVTTPGEGAASADVEQSVAVTDVLLPGDSNSFLTVGLMDSTSQGLVWRKLSMSDINGIEGEETVSISKLPTIPVSKITGLVSIATQTEQTAADSTYWKTSTGNNVPGKYYHKITLSTAADNNFTNKSPIVQLMLQNDNNANSFTIVNSTIEVEGLTVTVYSNIQFKGKILIIGI